MTLDDPARRTARPRRSRFDAALLAAFVGGATLEHAASAAGCSRRTAARRKAALQAELDQAEQGAIEAAKQSARARLEERLARIASGDWAPPPARAHGHLSVFLGGAA